MLSGHAVVSSLVDVATVSDGDDDDEKRVVRTLPGLDEHASAMSHRARRPLVPILALFSPPPPIPWRCRFERRPPSSELLVRGPVMSIDAGLAR